MNGTELVGIPAQHVGLIWPLIEEHVARACDRGLGDFSPDLVKTQCETRAAQLFVIWTGQHVALGVVITLFEEQPDGRTCCHIIACGGGNIALWLHHLAEIEAGARKNGAHVCRVIGRKGWTKMLPDYREVAVVLEKDLSNGQ